MECGGSESARKTEGLKAEYMTVGTCDEHGVYRGNAGVLSGLRVAPVGPEQSGVNVTEDMSAVSW